MERKYDLNLVVDLLVYGAVLFFIWKMVFADRALKISERETIILDVSPIEPFVGFNLQHGDYLRKIDSIKMARRLEDGIEPAAGLGTGLGIINTLSCAQGGAQSGKNSKIDKFYFKLPGWTLKFPPGGCNLDSLRYFVKNDVPFIRKVVWDKAVNRSGTQVKSGHYEDVEVPFRYHNEEKSLLIPISKSTKTVADIVFLLMIVPLGLGVLYLFLCLLKFLFDISRGKSFTDANVLRLKYIAFSLILFPFLGILLNALLGLFFSSYITDDLVYNYNLFRGGWKCIVVGIFFFALYKAFRKGRRLQEDQELTV